MVTRLQLRIHRSTVLIARVPRTTPQRRLHLPALVDLDRSEAQAEHQRLEGQDVEEQRDIVQRLGVREGSQG
ncbi:hypothetical protein CRUP_027472 [Coryphaenoides rupestris]|nr:hypothetical protein CRUP_027472 [Coryphaenoides rupestris]